MISAIQGKRVLFITTKNLDYIRNTQEMQLIQKYSKACSYIGSYEKSYPKRLLYVYKKLLCTQTQNFDIVFIGFAPQLVLPLFYWRFKNKTIIIDFFISMYDTLCCDRKKFHDNGLIGNLLHRIDQITLQKSDIIICDTNAHGKFFTQEFHAATEKLRTLYLEADSSIYYPAVYKKPENLKDKFIVLYFGSILPLQGVDTVLQAYDLLKTRKELYFYCIGPVSTSQKALANADNIEYIEWLSQEKLAEYIGFSDLCLAGHFHPTIEKAKRTIPGKAYIYHTMKKPMILGDTPANHELFDSDSNVSFVEPGNAIALANEIVKWEKRLVHLQTAWRIQS